MRNWLLHSDDAEPIHALRLLFWLRVVAIGAQSAVILFVHYGLGIALPLGPLALTITALAAWNLLTAPRIRKVPEVGDAEVALHLAVDTAAFTSVIYFTGGATNPFVSLYLLPICLAAASLRARYAWLIGGICAGGYTLLLKQHVPLPSVHHRFGGDFDLHVAGMWVNFLIAAALIVFFVGRMAHLVRQRDRQLAALREEALRDQQIIALGTLAAGTAHELNTPLSTLTLLVEELEETVADEALKTRLRWMSEEIDTINQRLNDIAVDVGAERSKGASCMSLRTFVGKVVQRWSDAHPGIHASVDYDASVPDTPIVAEATIEQAIRNVLDNAAHATRASGGSEVLIRVSCPNDQLTIAVLDEGAGLAPSVQEGIGRKVVSTKEKGLGIGLLISRASLRRFGGALELENRPAGGVEARIHLPLKGLLAHAK